LDAVEQCDGIGVDQSMAVAPAQERRDGRLLARPRRRGTLAERGEVRAQRGYVDLLDRAAVMLGELSQISAVTAHRVRRPASAAQVVEEVPDRVGERVFGRQLDAGWAHRAPARPGRRVIVASPWADTQVPSWRPATRRPPRNLPGPGGRRRAGASAGASASPSADSSGMTSGAHPLDAPGPVRPGTHDALPWPGRTRRCTRAPCGPR